MKIELFAPACEKPSAGLSVQRRASAARVIAAKYRFARAARCSVAQQKHEGAGFGLRGAEASLQSDDRSVGVSCGCA